MSAVLAIGDGIAATIDVKHLSEFECYECLD